MAVVGWRQTRLGATVANLFDELIAEERCFALADAAAAVAHRHVPPSCCGSDPAGQLIEDASSSSVRIVLIRVRGRAEADVGLAVQLYGVRSTRN
jgi:hypothetical protein